MELQSYYKFKIQPPKPYSHRKNSAPYTNMPPKLSKRHYTKHKFYSLAYNYPRLKEPYNPHHPQS